MSAPLLNASMFQPPGQAQGAGVGAGVAGQANGPGAGGALAGFEALLATLFGQVDAAGVAAAAPQPGQPDQATAGLIAAAPAAPAGTTTTTTADADPLAGATDKDASTDGATADDGSTPATSDAAQALAASAVQVVPAAVPTQAPATTSGDAAEAAAVTTDGTPGQAQPQPAQAAFDHANARAAFLRGLAPADDETGPDAPAAATADAAAPPSPQLPATAKAAPAKPAAEVVKLATADIAATPATPATPAAAAQPAPTPDPAATSPAPEASAPAPPAAAAAAAQATEAASAPRAEPSAKPRDRGLKATSAAAGPQGAAHAAASHSMSHAPHPNGVAVEAQTAIEAAAAQAQQGEDAGSDAKDAPVERADDATQGGATAGPANPTAPTPQMIHQAAVRGAPQTVANLAAQMVKKLEAKTTRFDLQLDPAGLGKVDVRVEIGASGQITAALACHNPDAARELQARSGELQRALEQAGFDLSNGGLSFEMAGGGNGQAGAGQGQNDNSPAFRGRAFTSALETAGDAALAAAEGALRFNRSPAAGVDIRI